MTDVGFKPGKEVFARALTLCQSSKLYITEICVSDFIEFIWDPLSTTQTRSLVRHCSMISEELSTCENEVNTGKPVMLFTTTSLIYKYFCYKPL